MMRSPDLHEEFLNVLFNKFPRKNILTNMISDILHIEKESAYRRLTGKVNFSAREIGIVAKDLGISLDILMNDPKNNLLLPFNFDNPMQGSMDVLYYIIAETLGRIERIMKEPFKIGNIYNSLPLEFFIHDPILTKFMFFKWGHYFVGGNEFNDYARWETPAQLAALQPRVKEVCCYESIYYIWDDGLIWTHLNEVANLYKMRIINRQDKNELREALKRILAKLEQILIGAYDDDLGINPDAIDFYVCSRSSGVTCNYYLSESQKHFAFLQTNFSHCLIDNNLEIFMKMKDWVDSFKRISTMLSQSGRTERRIFFDTQFKLIDLILDND